MSEAFMKCMKLGLFVSLSLCLFKPVQAEAVSLISENFEGVPTGDIVGKYNTGFNTVGQALYDKGWTVAGGCPGYYCPGSIVSITGHDGKPTQALRFRYEEGPASDSYGTGLEVKIAKECAFGAKYCFGQQQEIWERYYLMTQPVPANTPACAPNCPSVSTVNNVATKQHYFKALASPGGASFVTNFMWGNEIFSFSQQGAVDCPILNGNLNCPSLYGAITQYDNRWYCIETHIKINDLGVANGAIEVFVDGVPSVSSTNRIIQDATHRDAIDYVMIYRQSGGYQWRFEDDYEMATTRIGCSGTVVTSPTSGPRNPTGLQVL